MGYKILKKKNIKPFECGLDRIGLLVNDWFDTSWWDKVKISAALMGVGGFEMEISKLRKKNYTEKHGDIKYLKTILITFLFIFFRFFFPNSPSLISKEKEKISYHNFQHIFSSFFFLLRLIRCPKYYLKIITFFFHSRFVFSSDPIDTSSFSTTKKKSLLWKETSTIKNLGKNKENNRWLDYFLEFFNFL
jgi:hypothetical protein